jgi:hypothetical protein
MDILSFEVGVPLKSLMEARSVFSWLVGNQFGREVRAKTLLLSMVYNTERPVIAGRLTGFEKWNSVPLMGTCNSILVSLPGKGRNPFAAFRCEAGVKPLFVGIMDRWNCYSG